MLIAAVSALAQYPLRHSIHHNPDNASYHPALSKKHPSIPISVSISHHLRHHKPPTMSASSSSPPLTADSFSPLLPILNAFNHRHHNQHRLAHWWPVFRSLRRSIRNLIDNLSPPSTSLSSRPAAARREASSTSTPVPPRAVWLHKHFIPRAYVYVQSLPIPSFSLLDFFDLTKSRITNRAFSQLAADNQHAPLGLLLLAILSRIHAALSPLLSIDNSIPKPQPKTNRSNDLANQDKGVAIARQELPFSKASPSSTSTERMKLSATQNISDSSEQPQQQGSKVDREAVTPPKSKLNEEASSSSSQISKDKKKKKKGKGDALSSLFGSLA